jgi:hypothetical protein
MGKKHQALKAEDGEELQLLTPFGGDLKKLASIIGEIDDHLGCEFLCVDYCVAEMILTFENPNDPRRRNR